MVATRSPVEARWRATRAGAGTQSSSVKRSTGARAAPAPRLRAQAVLERVGAPQGLVEAGGPGGEAAVLLLQPRDPVLQAPRVGLGLVELVLEHRLVARGHRAQLVVEALDPGLGALGVAPPLV